MDEPALSQDCTVFQFLRGNAEVTQREQQEFQSGGMLEFPGITWTAWNEHFAGKAEEFHSHWTVGTKASAIGGRHVADIFGEKI